MGLFSFFKKVAKIAIPAAIAYFTGGASTAAGTGFAGMSAAATKAAGSALTGVLSGGLQSTKKTSPVTSVSAPAQSQTQQVDTSAAIAKQEQQKRLALNAGADTPSNALGVLGKPTVTKKKLLGA